MAPSAHAKIDELIARFDQAVLNSCPRACTSAVKEALEEIVRSNEDFLPEEVMRPAPDRYARRLLHKDPEGRYTAMVMVWGHGQGTPIHDHANMWCVECVYRGRIKVVSYRMEGDEEELVDFVPETTVLAGPGEAGALIPPFDHHTIENAEETPAVTLHIYGGEMTWCHAFVPVEGGGYRRVRRELSYTD